MAHHFPTTFVHHPAWCDQAKCPVTAAGAAAGPHRSAPFIMGIPGQLSTITISAEILKADAPWPTETFIKLDVAGWLAVGCFQPVSASTTVAANDLGALLQALVGVASRAVAAGSGADE